jgi:hypothetical protein
MQRVGQFILFSGTFPIEDDFDDLVEAWTKDGDFSWRLVIKGGVKRSQDDFGG